MFVLVAALLASYILPLTNFMHKARKNPYYTDPLFQGDQTVSPDSL